MGRWGGGGGGGVALVRRENCADMVQTPDEELGSRLPHTGLRQELELARLQRSANVATHTHTYSAYAESRHNMLTSSVRDVKGLEPHVTAASGWRLSIRSVCERDRGGEGL